MNERIDRHQLSNGSLPLDHHTAVDKMGDRGTQAYAYSGETTEWEVSPGSHNVSG